MNKTPKDVLEKVNEFLANTKLLRTACMGNAEKTIQGELFHFLKLNDLNAVIECGYRNLKKPIKESDRHIDLMIFNDEWLPLVAIELKHRSPHQGGIQTLINGLRSDAVKDRPSDCPLIHVGLYTAIKSITDKSEESTDLASPKSYPGYYRFLHAYVIGNLQNWMIKKVGQWLENDNQLLSNTNFNNLHNLKLNTREEPEEFNIGNLSVTGNVYWITMLTHNNSL